MEEWILVSPGKKVISKFTSVKNPLAILMLAQRMPCYPIYLPNHPTNLLNTYRCPTIVTHYRFH